jgi:ribosomal protein S27AE
MVFQRTATDLEAKNKRCPRCGKRKPLSEFGKPQPERGGTGHGAYCRLCDNARHREYKRNRTSEQLEHSRQYYRDYRKRSPAVFRKGELKRKFDMTVEEYEAMLDRQDGVCAICLNPPNGRLLAVDHDHLTGKRRGLLCSNCNAGIGQLHDSIVLLKAALRYLKRF